MKAAQDGTSTDGRSSRTGAPVSAPAHHADAANRASPPIPANVENGEVYPVNHTMLSKETEEHGYGYGV